MIRKLLLNPTIRNSIFFAKNNLKNECIRNFPESSHLLASYSGTGASVEYEKIPKRVSVDYDISDDFLDSYEVKHDLSLDFPSKSALLTKLKLYLDCDEDKAKEIVEKHKRLMKLSVRQLTVRIEQLFQLNISPRTIRENPWMLVLNLNYLKAKIEIIKSMEPKDINDFAPFLKCSPLRLSSAQQIIRKERKHIPERNRIYYLSKRLEVEPSIVSHYVSTHMFMFDISFDILIENLNIQLEYNIAPMNILRDLWAFKYLPKSVRSRLEIAKQAKKEKLMPWMVRCPEPVLAKSCQISVDCRKLLGENNDVVDYLSDRLGYDVNTTRSIALKHEAVLKVRVTKIKEILDYLLEEEQYEPYEIAACPRILCHSLETTKRRLNELKSYGCRPTALVIVCKSQREYQKFLQNWQAVRNLSV